MILSTALNSASVSLRSFIRNAIYVTRRSSSSVGPLTSSSCDESMDGSNNIIRLDMNALEYLLEILCLKVQKKKKNVSTRTYGRCVDCHSIDATVNVLQSGGVVAVPTDTLYGLSAVISDDDAIKKIFEIKKRTRSHSLAICVSEVEEIKMWATIPEQLIPLLEELFPGPVTVLLIRSPNLPLNFNSGNPLVGVRIPQHSFLRQVIRSLGAPIALTSANVSGSESTLSTQEFKNLWPELDLVVDGGIIRESVTHSRCGSTIIDLSNLGKFTIVRPGIDYEKILKLLKEKYHLEEN